MFKFLSLYIGNKQEAFYEDRFREGLNVIYSHDNNKGKTIVVQGLYYALGNNPIFPSGFDYENYYFIVDFVCDSAIYSICRRSNTILVKENDALSIFNSISEFKRYFDKKIYKLPRIIKNQRQKICDLELFYQIFFVGQDKRDTSKIFNSGYLNKEDFMEMLYSQAGCYKVSQDVNLKEVKENIKKLEDEKKILAKQDEFLKSKSSVAKFVTYTVDQKEYLKKINEIKSAQDNLLELKKERNRIHNRQIKNERLIEELRSLNRSLFEGELICMDCQGRHIGYRGANRNINFDVSNSEIRQRILSSIQDRVDSAKEDIEVINNDIFLEQNKLKKILEEDEISLEDLLFHKEEIINSQKIDEDIRNIDKKVDNFKNMIKLDETRQMKMTMSRDELLNSILENMNQLYKQFEPQGKIKFTSLFSKKDINYSGSEESEFYIVKLYALKKIFNLTFPIIIDGFRDGELSSEKEDILINVFSQLNNQVILTSTLKKEEDNKYGKYNEVNEINYSNNKTHHILSSKYLEVFIDKLSSFSINVS